MSERKEMDFSLENTWRLVEVVKTLDILSCFMMYTPPTVSESEASTLILNMKYAKVGRANKRVFKLLGSRNAIYSFTQSN